MNEGQKMFHGFIMKMVQDNKREEAEAILAKCFEKQDEGTFDKAYLDHVMPELRAVVKSEGLIQLEQAMAHFASKMD